MKIEYRGRSRPRPYGRVRKNSKVLPLLTLLLAMLILAYICLAAVDKRVQTIMFEIGSSKAQTLANVAVANAVETVLADTDMRYNELVSIEKDDTGNVKALSTDTVRLNQLKNRVTKQIEENFNVPNMNITIPLGNLFLVDMFSGRGPDVVFRLVPNGSITVTVKNEFIEAGINQTLHRIYLNANSNVSIVLPISKVNATIETSVCIAETVIVGTVPESYTNVSDLSDWAEDKLFDLKKQ